MLPRQPRETLEYNAGLWLIVGFLFSIGGIVTVVIEAITRPDETYKIGQWLTIESPDVGSGLIVLAIGLFFLVIGILGAAKANRNAVEDGKVCARLLRALGYRLEGNPVQMELPFQPPYYSSAYALKPQIAAIFVVLDPQRDLPFEAAI